MADHAHAQPTSLSQDPYVKIWALLLILLVVSVVGPFIGERLPGSIGKAVTLVTAFGIAIVKAYLVVKNFMHINVERKYVGYLLLTMLALSAVFVAGTAPDVLKHQGTNWENDAAKEAIHKASTPAPGSH